MPNAFDIVVIGAGTGGYVAAIRAAQLGKTVAVVEKQQSLGGTCLIWGCIPTKALLEHAHALKVVRAAKVWGITIPDGTPSIDMKQVHVRKDKIVTGLTKGIEYLFKKNKITRVRGTARLGAPGRVEIIDGEKQAMTAKEIIIATGSAPRSVPGIEINRKQIITSDQAIHLKSVPQSLIIMGSGAVGVEFASIYRRFGSEVTIIELLPRLVPVEDVAVSAELEKSFRKQRIKTLTGTRVTRATAGKQGVEIEVETPDGKTQKLSADLLLVATGRGPVTTNLGVEEAGVKLDKGHILVERHVPDFRCWNLSAWRCHFARNSWPSAARARVVGRRHPRSRAHRRTLGDPAQLRSRARLHVLRSGNWQRRSDRSRRHRAGL